jgi:hypothetical protein
MTIQNNQNKAKAIDAVAGILQALVKGMAKKKPGPSGAQNTNIAGCGGCSAKK